jgi:hypothetical protein
LETVFDSDLLSRFFAFYLKALPKMKITKRFIFTIFGLILLTIFLLWLIPWWKNGGWPTPGPVGNSLPPNIQHVMPGDGEVLEETYKFCVHYNYLSGSGMNEKTQQTPRYFFDGRQVTKHVYDIVDLEYPTQIKELCYRQSNPINPGWHTAKVTYEDNAGNRFEYMWRFQVIGEK